MSEPRTLYAINDIYALGMVEPGHPDDGPPWPLAHEMLQRLEQKCAIRPATVDDLDVDAVNEPLAELIQFITSTGVMAGAAVVDAQEYHDSIERLKYKLLRAALGGTDES